MSRPFPSKYENKGACARCNGDIKIGEMVLYPYKDSKDLAHETCPSATVSPPLPPARSQRAVRSRPRVVDARVHAGMLLVRRAFLRNAPPTSTELQEFRDFTLARFSRERGRHDPDNPRPGDAQSLDGWSTVPVEPRRRAGERSAVDRSPMTVNRPVCR